MKRAHGAASTLSSAPWAASFLLAFVGGVLGGALGGGTLVVDQRIASSGAPSWITCLALVSVTSCAVAAFAGALWFVHSVMRRAVVTTSDT
ncbi:hypothetical protein LVJ94_23585 [Pendulispora rubella]|uniref:Uncharacterized protein n=1 Tax=Pendulispora rubella TaxID=2741070 RepID=A0ABZ2LMU8_9BACT